MPLNLSSYAITPYAGNFYSIPMKLAKRGLMVPTQYDWFAYGILAGAATDSFVANVAVQIDLQVSRNVSDQMNAIRSVFIDNTGNPNPIYVYFPDTQATVQGKPYGAGWFPAFTNGFKAIVAASGLNAETAQNTNVYFSNVNAPPYSDAATDVVVAQYLSSPALGGGATLDEVEIDTSGTWYNAGTMSITGGGGGGANVSGTLDIYGRFVGTNVNAAGGGFTGTPIVAATAGQTPPAAFNSAATYGYQIPGNFVAYVGLTWYWNGPINTFLGAQAQIECGAPTSANSPIVGNQYNYGGNIYQYVSQQNIPINGRNFPAANNPSVYPPNWAFIGSQFPSSAGNWINTGVTSAATAASFTAILSPTTAPIVTAGFAAPALGDQLDTRIDNNVAGTGVFETGLFGTPYASGFIYLKKILAYVDIVEGAGTAQWNIVSTIGTILMTIKNIWQANQIGVLTADIDNMNLKIDATQTWTLNMTANGSTPTLRHYFVFTYSQQ
jgi:hypothetical protein